MKAPGPSRAGAFTPLMLPAMPRMQGAGQSRLALGYGDGLAHPGNTQKKESPGRLRDRRVARDFDVKPDLQG